MEPTIRRIKTPEGDRTVIDCGPDWFVIHDDGRIIRKFPRRSVIISQVVTNKKPIAKLKALVEGAARWEREINPPGR